ncbi:TraX family protein [Pseudobutyrivibrio xylanivorans]|uniref:TraX protein n=1 Tax=Pseudobutyrivibrio xylanivorans TaxID=185007 RepID=A0A1G5RR86_PSEXY|nr:TraX family protein [Pseudobutyrivibrio xylanivorans]SCZ76516.1 TraX protein [Pseudobutyrivibrio xylanivorans]
MENKAGFQITGNGLKLIAIITMLVDHVTYGLYYTYGMANDCLNWELYRFLRGVGRMAFPIYCFLLVEGFFHTRNVKKYAIRLVILALLSEIPFDWSLFGDLFVWNKTNVVFTLLIGLLLIWILEESKKEKFWGIENIVAKKLVVLLCYVAGMVAAYFASVDYNIVGVAVIVLMYCLHGEERNRRLLAFAAGVAILTLGCGTLESAAFLMLIPIAFYNGKRGSSSKIMRYSFNYFYPIHLFIIGIVRAILL